MLQKKIESLSQVGPIERFCRRLLLRKGREFSAGHISIVDHEGSHSLGSIESANRLQAEIVVHNPRFYRWLINRGNIGAAESWMEGDWSCNDLTSLIRIMVANLDVADRLEAPWGRGRKLIDRFYHWVRRNTPRSSRRNIRAHYDLGNQFFSLFLDPTMNYSSALFRSLGSRDSSESLLQAQIHKMDRICRSLNLNPSDRLLEIGTGWGGLACHAAQHYGCQVTTTTISQEQFHAANQRVRELGLENQVTVLDQDYRNLEGKYDKIVSVEMIEAVGDQFYPVFFDKCNQLLKDEGMMLLQAITIVDQRYRQHLNSVDFICKYIFPGGSLPSITRLTQVAADTAAMRLIQFHDFAPHYAETLRRWRCQFWKNIDSIKELGYDHRFIRMWDYYLAYCECGFDERQINVSHLLFAKRACRHDPEKVQLPAISTGQSRSFNRSSARNQQVARGTNSESELVNNRSDFCSDEPCCAEQMDSPVHFDLSPQS